MIGAMIATGAARRAALGARHEPLSGSGCGGEMRHRSSIPIGPFVPVAGKVSALRRQRENVSGSEMVRIANQKAACFNWVAGDFAPKSRRCAGTLRKEAVNPAHNETAWCTAPSGST
jgi:hypothetical protein